MVAYHIVRDDMAMSVFVSAEGNGRDRLKTWWVQDFQKQEEKSWVILSKSQMLKKSGLMKTGMDLLSFLRDHIV